MLKQNHTHLNHNLPDVAVGLFLGGLIGAGTMLLLAPQSGKKTRQQILQKEIELRDRAIEMAEDAMTKARLESRKLSRNAQHKAKEIIHQGQEMVSEQLAHMSEFVENGKKSLLNSKN